jgi:hypothetical protein
VVAQRTEEVEFSRKNAGERAANGGMKAARLCQKSVSRCAQVSCAIRVESFLREGYGVRNPGA